MRSVFLLMVARLAILRSREPAVSSDSVLVCPLPSLPVPVPFSSGPYRYSRLALESVFRGFDAARLLVTL